MTIVWSLFEILLNSHDAAFLISVPTKHNEKRDWVKKWHIIAYYLGTVGFFCLFNFVTEFSPFSAYALILPSIIYVLCFFQGGMANRLFWGIFTYASLICIDIISSILVMSVARISLDMIFSSSMYRIIAVIISKSILFLMWRVLLKMNLSSINLLPYGLLTGICIATLVFAMNMVLLFGSSTQIGSLFITYEYLLMVFSIFCLLMLLLMVYRSVLQMKEKYTLSIVNSYTRSRDFRNHLLDELQPLWPLRYDCKVADAPVYRKAFEHMDEALKSNFQTGNEFADAVLLLHEAEAFEAGILLIVKGSLSALNPIKTGDICFILDQLLTVIVQKMKTFVDSEATKVISLNIVDNQDELVFQLENPSWREDKAFDLILVSDIAKKYRGTATTFVEDFYRTTTISLPYPRLVSI